MRLAALLSLVGLVVGAPHCEMTEAYPPPANQTIGWKVVNLDSPAIDRWTDIVQPLANEIKALTAVITNIIPAKILNPILKACGAEAQTKFLDRFPNDFGEELMGIHLATGEDLCTLIVYNLAYEVLGGCTSIVAQDADGHIFHARNLDFGLGPYNASEAQWQLTDKLRPLLVNVDFQKGGQTLFKATHYAGYIGVLTAMKEDAFTITVDTRFDNSYDKFLVKWIEDVTDSAQFLGFLTRQTMEEEGDFAAAKLRLTSTVMIGPSYVILGGVTAGEGVVVTNSPNMTHSLDVWDIAHGRPQGSPFYVLETNYDHWVQPPFFDNRRDPADDCMNQLGVGNISKATLYNVLHAHPNRNRLTTYTALLSAGQGLLESSVQYCEEPGCVPW